MNLHLSKTHYIRGLQCHKSLWLFKNHPELRMEADTTTQAHFDTGKDVGLLAQQRFPGGETIEFEGTSFEEKINRTRDLIQSGATSIYEATFCFEGLLVMVDILRKGLKGWELYEVKKSTSVKPVHEDDVAFQYYVLQGAGIDLARACLVHINNQYVRQGDLNLTQLFSITDLTESAREKQKTLSKQIKTLRKAISKGEPDIDIGPHCSDPYNCDFADHCWAQIPSPSIFDLSWLRTDKKFALYKDGITRFEDLPEDFALSDAQEMQVEAELSGKEYIDKTAIRNFLKGLSYPIYFLDFETFKMPVPLFDGIRPHQQIPFQFSLHYQGSKKGKLKHFEFLGKEGQDPRRDLIRSLLSNIGEKGCVLVYNASFEPRVLRELAGQFPKNGKRLRGIVDRIVDLMVPFRQKAIYKKEMNGSYSIKSVLPALVSELSYEEMAISNGGDASNTYASLHLIEDKTERNKIRKDLLEYCKLDTLGMVKILEQMKIISKK